MDKPKPCPFCGSSDATSSDDPAWIGCGDCGTWGPIGHDHDEAVAAWNRRTPDLAAIRVAVVRYLGAAAIYSGRKGGMSPAMEDARAALDALLGGGE